MLLKKDIYIMAMSIFMFMIFSKLMLKQKLTVFFNMEKMPYFLILMSCWIIIITILMNNTIKKYFLLMMILMVSMMFFLSNNILMFYITFEMMFPMMMFLIYSWGKSYERFKASSYFFMYGMIGSMPLLMSIIILYYNFYSMNMFYIFLFNNMKLFIFVLMFMFLGFMIKAAVYWFHYWLPLAHVESPTEGSMFLASVMMKFGIYAMIRFYKLFMFLGNKISNMLLFFILVGSIYSTILCISMNDLKKIIAYSSISHMSFSLIVFLNMKFIGMLGMMILMISHGILSPSLFFLINPIMKMFGNRNTNLLSNMHMKSLLMFVLMSMMFLMNMSIPPSLNFFSEVLLVTCLMTFTKMFGVFLMMYFLLFMMMATKIIMISSLKTTFLSMMFSLKMIDIFIPTMLLFHTSLLFYSMKMFF
uniref:NADH dehydrogenase subunit 4 n=1 Tax=Intoshia linei TaxID=1819745 RepID=UPI001EE03D1C|nr:NADH dehydrogenase subunit 4 [Intoshia linei]UIB41611.1 NADH dehydrogenase subunit 4 [Intoshia linei]